MPKQRGDTGQYVETVTLEDVLEVFDRVDGPPVVTSADVSEETGLSRDSARRKLETLRDRGEVDRRRTAGRVLYWPVDGVDVRPEPRSLQEPGARDDIAASDLPADAEMGEDEADEAAETPGVTPGETASRDLETVQNGENGPSAPAVIGQFDLSGSGETLRRRRAAVAECYLYLREKGMAQKRDFVQNVYPEHPAGYSSEGGWWNVIGKDGLRRLAEETDDVQAPAEGEHNWAYAGDRER